MDFVPLTTALPVELVLLIIKYYVSDATIDIYRPNSPRGHICPHATSPTFETAIQALPPPFLHFYMTCLHQATKHFKDSTISDAHLLFLNAKYRPNMPFNKLCESLLGMTMESPDTPTLYNPLNRHGLESVRLNFTCEDYFAFFNVTVPPFDMSDWRDQSPIYALLGEAALLQHTETLILDFSGLYEWAGNPWMYNCVGDPRWDFGDFQFTDWEGNFLPEPRFRTNICTKGLIVDWILTYAYYRGYIRYIPKVYLEGRVQGWVREKWGAVFAQGVEERVFEVTDAEIEDIEKKGMNRRVGESGQILDDPEWRPQDFYAPTCTCRARCETLGKEESVDEDMLELEFVL